MSQNQQSYGPGRNQGGGSVRRAREMLNAGARGQGQYDRAVPPPVRPRQTHSRSSSQEADIEIGFEYEDDPRGPVPIMPIQGLQVPRHSGPPPSSRRGPSSIYSRLMNGTAVSPIPEENVRQTRKKKESFASSTVIPSSWGSGTPLSDDSELEEPKPEPKQEPKRSKGDSLNILRQASLGKLGKPALRTVSKAQAEQPSLKDKSSESSLVHSTTNGLQPRASSESTSTDTNSIDIEKERIEIENEQKARSIGIGAALGRPGAGMSSRKPNSHRPPELDLNKTRLAEAHGSLTSLPDLIRRATKLASNLEHGRTASRLGVLDMFDFGGQGKRARASPRFSDSASMSDILASFPPPRTSTPDESDRTSWPYVPTNNFEKSRLREMQRISGGEYRTEGKPRRRCCGMTMPVFIFVCIIILSIVAAAVVIPIVFVVIPRNNHHPQSAAVTNTTTPAPTCEQQLPCLNGGVSVQSSSTCSCVCIDGFSGTQCATASDGSCTTTKTSQSDNATVGSSLPSLFAQSEADFNIPLNENEILSLFNANNVSCTVQNALVEFAGLASSKLRRQVSPIEVRALEEEPLVATTSMVRRAAAPQAPSGTYVPPILSIPTATATQVAGAMQPAAAATTTQPAASATSASPAASTSAASVSGAAARVYEFARVAVLFIFEQTQDIAAATTAQRDIDMYLLSKDLSVDTNMKMSVTQPQSFVLNFTNFTITLSNGTVVGGGNGTAT